jgi:hypothetical protein
MTESEAVEIVHRGLVSQESLPVRLRMGEGLDEAQLAQVKAALHFLVERWRGRTEVPKRLAAAFVDLQSSMQWGWDRYSETEQMAIEDAANELVDLAYQLFEE